MADVISHQSDVDQRQPLDQDRVLFELSQNSEGNGGVGAGPWAGQFTFNTDTNNPWDTNYNFANALIGSFQNYTEIDAFSEVVGKRYISEFYVQDTWKVNMRLTFDYGLRFLWYTPWYSTQPAAVFVPERYDPAMAPRLISRRDQQRERRLRSGDGCDATRTYSSARLCRALATVTTAWSATAILITRRASGIARVSNPSHVSVWRGTSLAMARPRSTRAWGSTTTPTSTRTAWMRWRETHLRRTLRALYGTMDTLLAAGAQGAFSNRPSDVFGIQRDAKTPKSYNYSVGIQRDIGWGTVLDVTYAGFQMRNGEMATSINTVPDQARLCRHQPAERQPAEPDHGQAERVPAAVSGLPEHHDSRALRRSVVQLAAGAANRRYINGLQFAVACTLREDRRRRHGR